MKRDSRLAPVLAIVGGAIVLVVALVIASQISNSKKSSSNIQTDSIAEMLRGIPQKGIELGNPKAKLTLVEISDPQCPFCAEWARGVFPTLVQNYVRAGKLRIEYQGLGFLDDRPEFTAKDSDRLLALAQAAGLQNKLWYVVELEFENQGAENSGYASDPFLRGIAQAVDGLDADKALAAANTNAVVPMINAAQKLAQAKIGKKISTPTFLLGPTGSAKTEKIVGALPVETFTAAIDAQLKK